MVRPRKIKSIGFKPGVTYFKPRAVPLTKLEEIELTLEELETLRQTNLENLSQADAAKKMSIHQSTFQRTLVRARQKITDALVNGKAIQIKGGEFKIVKNAGMGGYCICNTCGKKEKHIRGQPCNQIKCCNTMMERI